MRARERAEGLFFLGDAVLGAAAEQKNKKSSQDLCGTMLGLAIKEILFIYFRGLEQEIPISSKMMRILGAFYVVLRGDIFVSLVSR